MDKKLDDRLTEIEGILESYSKHLHELKEIFKELLNYKETICDKDAQAKINQLLYKLKSIIELLEQKKTAKIEPQVEPKRKSYSRR
jgi:hypothetical protein